MHSFTVLLSLGSLYCKFKPQGINLPLTQSWRRHLHVAFFLSFTLSLSLSLFYFSFLFRQTYTLSYFYINVQVLCVIGDVSFLHDTNGLAILNQRWEIYLVVLKACVTLYSCIFFFPFNFLSSCFISVSYQTHPQGISCMIFVL